MTATLTEVFRQSAEQAYNSFPERLGRLLVFVDDVDTPVYLSPDIADSLSAQTQEVSQFMAKQASFMKEKSWAGVACSAQKIADEADLNTIGIHAAAAEAFQEKRMADMYMIYILDHELGHHVVPTDIAFGHPNECRADAYAALRHIQRFGMSAEFERIAEKSRQMIFGLSPMHYTSRVFDTVRKYAANQDLRDLSPIQTVQLAERIAIFSKMSNLQMMRVARAYEPAANNAIKRYKTKDGVIKALRGRAPSDYTFFCKQVAAVMHAYPDDADIIQAGQRFFSHPDVKKFLEGRVSLQTRLAK